MRPIAGIPCGFCRIRNVVEGIEMKRYVLNAVCALGLSLSVMYAQAVVPDYQDWWWEASKSGMGVSIAQQDDVLAVAWYFFDRDRRGTFLVLSGKLDNNRLTGDLVRTIGPEPGVGYDRALVVRTVVGKGTIEFKSPSEASFSYQYDGLSGVMILQRFAYRGVPDFSQAVMAGSLQQTGCGNWRLAGAPVFNRPNALMHVALTRVGDNQYDLRLGSIEGTGGKSFWCEARGLYLFPYGGMLNGAGSMSCAGREGNNGEVILPLLAGTPEQVNAKIIVNSMLVSAERTMIDLGIDFGTTAKTQCMVTGSFQGLALPDGE